ncbi:MAG: hypothetical protein F4X99_09115 [Gammaproteobacteria bacterium]|nr:hypothetical protein [Gammaproteobacteria bacterium]
MTDDRTSDDAHDRLRRIVDEGAQIVGGASGPALGLLSGDPALGVVLGGTGAAAASALRHIGQEFVDRFLGPRERKRVGAVIAVIADDLHAKLSSDEPLRDDAFFDPGLRGRSDGDEVAESVLLKCQREPEEKKVPYMGHFFANVAFRPDISALMAHQLAKHAEQLTYRQFCLLNLATYQQSHHRLRSEDYRGQKNFTVELLQVLYELLDLYNRGFINFGGEVAFGPTDVKPGSMRTQGLGSHLAVLLDVSGIPDDDLTPIVAQLSVPSDSAT